MEKPKSKVVKSKSSNSAITNKSENPDKQKITSRSSAEFQTLTVKKRGMYVEKQLNTRDTDSSRKEPMKPPPRPPPGQKRFLASVLSILAKSTTGTQHPDPSNEKINKTKVKTRRKAIKENIDVENENIDLMEHNEEAPTITEKKKKYRSKVLNNYKNQLPEEQKFQILKSKKDIILTPSMNSGVSNKEDNFKWPSPSHVKPDEEETSGEVEKNINSLVKEVLEGRQVKAKKVRVVDEPSTFSSEHKDEKVLYNLFVDLLEKTLSVYNVNDEHDTAPNIPSANSSKVALEIDESVVNKLVAPKMFDDVTQNLSNHIFSLRTEQDEKSLVYFETAPTPPKRTRLDLPFKSSAKRRKQKSESCSLMNSNSKNSKMAPLAPAAYSAVMSQKKSFYKKNNKKNLLNLLKEQLSMDNYTFEEPQNLFQALKVMARNKRKCQKTIRFDKSAKSMDENECIFKGRKVISPRTKSNSKFKENDYFRSISHVTASYSNYSRKKIAKGEYNTDYEMSNHSIEVYGFDYEVPVKKNAAKHEKENRKVYGFDNEVTVKEPAGKQEKDRKVYGFDNDVRVKNCAGNQEKDNRKVYGFDNEVTVKEPAGKQEKDRKVYGFDNDVRVKNSAGNQEKDNRKVYGFDNEVSVKKSAGKQESTSQLMLMYHSSQTNSYQDSNDFNAWEAWLL